ncbi:cysteine dioxygenase family protein [Methylovirgula sp. 4M-Z18]|uniref:cysteine dioxygenase family protein n=1 Tax=Methylovirgula sp. 4M-Z18 TaxID=2293567 RepID=UPI000E2FD471|nr:cysteine dioxygenase family protein [Methylovirgula sp. 4M-Z18]RFB75590.1 cysteine dioxygenase [Methylovirgula sp. 4M-Z18]
MTKALDRFIDDAHAVIGQTEDAAERVTMIAPLMRRLLDSDRSFLQPAHFRSNPEHYERNAIHISDDGNLSLFALVWLPGQWTPVHDHGSWGVVGIVQGLLEERSYMAADGEITRDTGIRLRRGGVILLNPGSVTSFVPNPDHIHMTGVAAEREMCVSLHVYGRNMNSFHIYDVAAGTRRMIEVAHQESR